LWFEHLANAVKKTEREHIDVEIDIPRRLWMRSEAERVKANGQLFDLLRGLEDSERHIRLAAILKQLLAPCEGERFDQMLTWEQARLMTRQRIDFGGHTVTHPFMSKLTSEQAEWEIGESKRRIEEELQRTVRHFAYPNGKREDFSANNKYALRNAGYLAAVSTIWGVNDASTDPMELRRGGPWQPDPAMFAYKLDWYHFVNG